MSKAYASIMKGLEEIKAHNEGKIQLKTSIIEIIVRGTPRLLVIHKIYTKGIRIA